MASAAMLSSTPGMPGATPGMPGQVAQAQPLNESQVQAAVTFLQHPKVVSTSAANRVAFLTKKGLTTAEIAEAFKRALPNSPETAALAKAVQEGKSAAEAVSSFPASTVTAAATPPQPAAAAAVPTPAAVPPAAAPAQTYQQPYAGAAAAPAGYHPPAPYTGYPPPPYGYYPPPHPGAHAPPPAAQPQATSWTSYIAPVGATVTAVAGLAYLAKRYWNAVSGPSQPAQPQPQQPAALTAPQAQPALPAPIPTNPYQSSAYFSSSTPSSVPSAYPSAGYPGVLGGSSGPTPAWKEEQEEMAQGLKEVQNDVSVLRDQTSELKRTLHTIQATLDSIKKERKSMDEVKKSQQDIQNQLSSLATLLQKLPNAPAAAAVVVAPVAAGTPGPSPATPPPVSPATPLAGAPAAATTAAAAAAAQVLPSATGSLLAPMPTAATTNPSEQWSADQTAPQPPALAPSEPVSVDALVEASRAALQAALAEMQDGNLAEDLKTLLDTLFFYINNIVLNPDQPRYRRIMTTNPNFQTRIKRMRGGERFLEAAGFRQKETYWDVTRLEPVAVSGPAEEAKEMARERSLKEAHTLLKGAQDSLRARLAATATSSATSASVSSSATVSTNPLLAAAASVNPSSTDAAPTTTTTATTTAAAVDVASTVAPGPDGLSAAAM